MDKMYSVEELRGIIGCSREKIYQVIHSVGFPKIKIGRQYYIPVDKFNNWVNNHLNSSIIL